MQPRYGRRLRQTPGSGLAAWIFVAALSSIAFARPDPYDAAVEASSFSPQRALTFGLFSKIMYCDPTSIEEWSCPPCQRVDPTFSGKVFANSSTDFLALVGSNDGNIVVAFRGSDNLENVRLKPF